MTYIFAAPPTPSVPIAGRNERFPVHRIYCIGRNYAEHAREMGHEPEKGTPVFFMKPADAVVSDGRNPGFPMATSNLHHEVEMVVALSGGGRNIPLEHALELVYGYSVGVDLTRRDLQAAAKVKGNPWDTAKGFDDSAPIGHIVPARGRHPIGERLELHVNDQMVQGATIADMLWSVPEIIVELSKLYELRGGDLIYTGTPAGVGPLQREDQVHCSLEGWCELEFGFHG
ncbi:MAG: fumarylacetoacetate hydrolase family protein [Lysobacterales bacterium]